LCASHWIPISKGETNVMRLDPFIGRTSNLCFVRIALSLSAQISTRKMVNYA